MSYTAIPHDCGCGGPCCDEPLGAYSIFNSPFPGPLGPPSGNTLPYVPGGGVSSLPFDYSANRKWYDPIIDFAGDVGGELLGEVKDWLLRRIGRETWDRLPDTSKEEAVRAALEDIHARSGLPSMSTLPWIIGGVAALLLVARR